MSQSPSYPHTLEGDAHIMYLETYCGMSKPIDSESLSPIASSSMVPSTPPSPPSPSPPMSSRNHIRRPPNAFMIYRSELIKKNMVPSRVEHRQQHISQIAGQCWNMLPAEDKAVYHEKAKRALAEHQLKHPNYKFTPAPRGSKRGKAKAQEEEAPDNADRLKYIRETYCGLVGPTIIAQRKKKRKTKEHRASGEPTQVKQRGKIPARLPSPLSPAIDMNPGLSFSGPSTPESHVPITPTTAIAGGSNMNNVHIQQPMPILYQSAHSTDIIRRPSTTGCSRDLYTNPSLFNYASSDSLSSALYSPLAARHRSALPQGLDLRVPAAPQAEQVSFDGFVSSFANMDVDYSAFGSNVPSYGIPYHASAHPDLLGMAGFNQQQQQVLDDSAIGGSHGSVAFGLHVRSMSDSVCPLDTAGTRRGAYMATGLEEWDMGMNMNMNHRDWVSGMSPAEELAMNTPSPSASVGSSQL